MIPTRGMNKSFTAKNNNKKKPGLVPDTGTW